MTGAGTRTVAGGLLRRLLCAAALAALVAAHPPGGALAQDGEVQLDEKTQAKVNKLIAAAEGGDRASQLKLGLLYLGAKGFPKDYEKAYAWFAKAAEAGSINATYNLGILTEKGRGTEADPAKALEFYLLAAAQEVPNAQYKVWKLAGSDEELAVAIKPQVPLQYLMASAKGGHVRAQAELGEAYLEGELVKKNIDKAVALLQRAAQAGDSASQKYLGSIFSGNFEGYDADPVQAEKWLLPMAAAGDAFSQRSLADLYMRGVGGAPDYGKAKDWYGKAARKGDPDAKTQLGRLHMREDTGLHDITLAEKWLTDSANEKRYDAQYYLFELLYDRATRQKDLKGKRRAVVWLKSSAWGNFPEAQHRIARLYFEGEVVPRSPKEAYIWVSIAAENGLKGAAELRAKVRQTMSSIDAAEAESEVRFRVKDIETKLRKARLS